MQDCLLKFNSKDIMIRCASNNNETMRDIYRRNLKKSLVMNENALRLTGANFDEKMIQTKLLKKHYPLILIEKYMQDFKFITNGIPIFVDMINSWPKNVLPYKTNPDELEKSNNLEINPSCHKLISENFKYLHKKIESYQIEKIMKFKLEYYDKFNDEEKEKFKEILMALENEDKILDIAEYENLVDYQLMDYEYHDKSRIKIKTDFPDVLRLYKKYLRIKIKNREELKIYVNIMKSYIYKNDPEVYYSVGNAFEMVVKSAFQLNNTFDEKLYYGEMCEKLKNFNVYNSLFFRESFELNVFSQDEMNSAKILNRESLPSNQILRSKILHSLEFKATIPYNMFFFNEYRSIPIIDGGFKYSKGLLGRYGIITFDAAVGHKQWSHLNIQFENELLESLNERFPSSNENIETEALKKVIVKLEQCLPRTFREISAPEWTFEYEKHLIVLPDLKEMIAAYINNSNFFGKIERSNLDSIVNFQNYLEEKYLKIAKFIENCPELKSRIEICLVVLKPVLVENEVYYESSIKQFLF